jgi:predicted Fe-Mo cluster-binding NifX family protein
MCVCPLGAPPISSSMMSKPKKVLLSITARLQAQEAQGIKAAQTIVDNKAAALLTPRLGANAAGVLEPAEIKIYKTTAASAKDNIEAFAAGKLSLLDEIHAGFRGAREQLVCELPC